MSFDFASDRRNWRHRGGAGAKAPRLAAASRPVFAVPQRPTLDELAGLVRELFAEGTLSWDQLWSLACLPDLAPHLAKTLDTAPDLRKPLAAE